VKFVWGKRFYVFLFATARGTYNNIIYTSEYKHFHLAKKVRWLAAIHARVRACVCVRSSSPSTLHNGWQGCFFFSVASDVEARRDLFTSPTDHRRQTQIYIYTYAAWWRWCSRGNCLWTSSPGKLENADCPTDSNEWQSCHAAFFLSIPLPPRHPAHHLLGIYSFPFPRFFRRVPTLTTRYCYIILLYCTLHHHWLVLFVFLFTPSFTVWDDSGGSIFLYTSCAHI